MTSHRIPTTRSLTGAVLALAAGAALTACSTSGSVGFGATTPSAVATHSTQDTSPPARPPSSQAPSSQAPSSEASSDGSGSSAVTPLLLDAGEIGGGFDRVESDPTDTPLPCTPDEPGPLTEVPATGHAQIDFVSPSQDVAITERVITYAGEGDSERVLDAVHRGFGCATADAGGATLRIAGPQDVRSVITATVDQADYWQLRSDAGDVDMVVVRTGSTVVQLAFSSKAGTSIQIDPDQVLQTAVAKAINGG